MSPRRKRGGPRRLLDWKAFVGIGISALLLYLTFRRMDMRAVWENLRGVNVPLFLLSSVAATGVFWIRAWRWRGILRPVHDVPFRPRFAAVTIGFMGNNLLPARVGEFLRAYALSRMQPVPVVASFASLVIERLFDGIFVIALLFVAMSLPGFPVVDAAEGVGYTGYARAAAVIVLVITAMLMALVLMPKRAVSLMERVVTLFPQSVRRPIVDALEAFLSGVGILRDPRLLLGAGAWSLLLWTFNAVGFWIAFHAFGLPLPFTAALFFQSAIALAVSVPSGPAFVGVYHGAAVFVLSRMWGAPEAAAGAFAVGFHIAGFVPVTLIGLYYAWRMGLSIGDVKKSEEIVETAVEAETPDARRKLLGHEDDDDAVDASDDARRDAP